MHYKSYRFLTPLIMALAWANLEAQTANPVPRLVVNVMIDQLRTDYMEAFSSLFGNGGFNRVMREGRSYMDAAYPFSNIDRASAVACVMTGAVPYDNGIVGERWMDRSTLRPMYCVDDPTCQGWMTSEKYSPVSLNVSTIADELKVATGGRALVYSIAPDADAAILGAGHAADGAFWIDEASGQWSSTSYYGQYPDWALRYDVPDRLSSRISGLSWTPVSPIVENFNFFISPQESKGFNHKFTGDRKIREFKTSACVNDEVNRFAQFCLDNTEMGSDGVTDFLSLTYYAGTFDHKPVPDSPVELQDTYVRLDMKLAELISMLDKKVGAGRFLLVITSTGYADDEMTDFSKYRIPTGTFSITRASALLNMYLMAIYGQGKYVEAEFGSQLFLNQKLIEDKQLNLSDVLTRSQAFLIQMAGVKDVYTSQRLALSAGMPDIRRLRNSFNQMRSGDIFIEVSPGWKMVNEETHEQILERASYVDIPLF
ncbi:MAG: alkaline phosphatase family protein, partial [Paraprevotella sp.]|nr:alkaline phosphatase family protein [Paraprevotella sp.]